ncbi:MAG: 50S ribosomal protein L10 [Candidatus Nitrosocosmicus sp.]|jgi:large subunit ribosomal protein L10|uniref:50S ribosomal protein L10 n=1 Tax=Candidatus Nitrosocosmicus agrestis TaxID=2563600 RepID=UPI00122DF601|nr:50S ribosomal protein L10 [Candidatus Nitrosocosmicus sp. SS]KAA2279848.1 50S ribosomal protein L10 [Candidatus Nitrosocosmicus sp. SS]KAF0870376.1 50S ribosomal protein L10 [Candidatus Nitrosocosmicus sp. SS]MDR4491159.1 50S ribosomal protein L10 [Candidatus Nitrosocosmicus sp.]HET6589432.1 50S ribosomal protein L10 [Candidatus Nitrosocosmicus sp.]
MSQTVVTNKLNRTSYPERKVELYNTLQELAKSYNVIALSRMTKVRSAQLMAIRKKFKNEIKILTIKNKVAQRAFEKIFGDVKGLELLNKELEGQCALMFTNISPFKMNLTFDKNKILMAAKGGDIAPNELLIPAGNTGINPGPVLSEFKESNVPTRIDQGTIWVSKDTVVAKPGDVISQKLAALLSKLDVKPIEAGISVNYAISEGLEYREKDLKIVIQDYVDEIVKSFQEALSLSVEAVYFTKESVPLLLMKAKQHGISLSTESGYLTPETVNLVLSKANAVAGNLAQQLGSKGFSTSS